jgi:hypothetical protein
MLFFILSNNVGFLVDSKTEEKLELQEAFHIMLAQNLTEKIPKETQEERRSLTFEDFMFVGQSLSPFFENQALPLKRLFLETCQEI